MKLVYSRLALALLLLTGVSAARAASPAEDPAFYARHIYPLAKPIRAPRIIIDVTDAPEARPWAEQARTLSQEWFPLLTQLLATEEFKPKKTIKLIFKKGIGPPAYMSNGDITIKAEWIASNPDDLGMVIHELVHVIQAYPNKGNKPGWLVEGIADYIRWWRYEPEVARTPINSEKASYRDSYRTTAWFLAWITGKYNRAIVPQLDRALRSGTYSDDLFQKATGKTLDDLWTEFLTTPRRAG